LAETQPEQRRERESVLKLAVELFRSDEKTAADREAKLAILKFLAMLENGKTDDYLKGFREGYTEGFRDGYTLRVTEEEQEGHRYGA